MEKSKWPKRLSKLGYAPSSAQRMLFRFSSIEQAMESEDYTEEGVRYVSRKQTSRAYEGERTQPRRMGRNTGGEET